MIEKFRIFCCFVIVRITSMGKSTRGPALRGGAKRRFSNQVWGP